MIIERMNTPCFRFFDPSLFDDCIIYLCHMFLKYLMIALYIYVICYPIKPYINIYKIFFNEFLAFEKYSKKFVSSYIRTIEPFR